ncbi:MAG: uroporphyrinogen-III synthase [Thiomicrorhabdus sp.]|nr:uroporphyrinogen-III synthase [Thiomicrorhabdus sp.]
MQRFTLLNTRPAHQVSELNRLVETLGGEVVMCPTMEIDWLSPGNIQVTQMTDFDMVIFTSVNAIDGWLKWLQSLENRDFLCNLQCYAIGKATQKRGVTLGLNIATLSNTQFDSEHLLAHQEMQHVVGLKIALVKGVNGRTLIEDTLKKRGAEVTQLNVYQRKPLTFCWQAWQDFIVSAKPILLITSCESWHNLFNGLKQSLNDLKAVVDSLNQVFAVVVMSHRIADEIVASGCSAPINVVATQSNQGIVEAIQQYV